MNYRELEDSVIESIDQQDAQEPAEGRQQDTRQEVKQDAAASKKDEKYCKQCRFYGMQTKTCDYILLVGHPRGCTPGDGCEKRELQKGKRKGQMWTPELREKMRAITLSKCAGMTPEERAECGRRLREGRARKKAERAAAAQEPAMSTAETETVTLETETVTLETEAVTAAKQPAAPELREMITASLDELQQQLAQRGEQLAELRKKLAETERQLAEAAAERDTMAAFMGETMVTLSGILEKARSDWRAGRRNHEFCWRY